MPAVDAHLHLWDPERLDYRWLEGPLRARFAAAEVAAAPADAGTSPATAVFVQAECVEEQFLDEARWVAATAADTGVRGIVAGARLDRGAKTAAHLDALAAIPLVVGVRHLLQGEPDGLATTPAFLAGAEAVAARGWTFDACVRAHQLPDVVGLAAAVPALRVVLDHLGKPGIGTADAPLAPDAAWIRDLHALAALPNTSCKLSGLPAEAGGRWSPTQVAPFLDAAAEAFGPQRLLWGSDWPVSAVGPEGYRADDRGAWLRTVAGWAAQRGLDVDAILGGTAIRVYGLA